nr:MAG TPA: regulatory protein [Caudoviricetes sp.]
MTNLVQIKNAQPVTTSLQVAETFEKNHKDVMRDIRNLRSDIKKVEVKKDLESADLRSVDTSMFLEDSYKPKATNADIQ